MERQGRKDNPRGIVSLYRDNGQDKPRRQGRCSDCVDLGGFSYANFEKINQKVDILPRKRLQYKRFCVNLLQNWYHIKFIDR